MNPHAMNRQHVRLQRRYVPVALCVTLLLAGSAAGQVVLDMPPVPTSAPQTEEKPEPSTEGVDAETVQAPSRSEPDAERAALQHRQIDVGRLALKRYLGARTPARRHAPVGLYGVAGHRHIGPLAGSHVVNPYGFTAHTFHTGSGFFGFRSHTFIVPSVVIVPPSHRITIKVPKRGEE